MTISVLQSVNNPGGATLSMAAYASGSRLLVGNHGRGTSAITLTGATFYGDLNANGYSDVLQTCWRASAGQSTTIAPGGTFGSGGNVLWAVEIGDCGDPIQEVNAGDNTSHGDKSLTITGVTAGSLLVAVFLGAAADAWAGNGWTPNSGWTELIDTANAGHPFAWIGYQIASGGGSYTAQPTHGVDWTSWSPKGEDARIVEFPAVGGGGSGRSAGIINMAKKLIVPDRRIWVPG